jgi:hypothetical protein
MKSVGAHIYGRAIMIARSWLCSSRPAEQRRL